MDKNLIRAWLQEVDPQKLNYLWEKADEIRQKYVGDDIWLRGLVEISNHCVRSCAYCGISKCAPVVEKYRMSEDEILTAVKQAADYGFGTVVLQSGEDMGLTATRITEIIRSIKSKTGLAITLSLGERSVGDLEDWRKAGADRYLLRFETSDVELYKQIHPNTGRQSDRFVQLELMRQMGYEIGTGVMVGIPGQTWGSLANDIWLFRKYGMDMIGLGPYLENEGTPLAGELGKKLKNSATADQVPNDDLTTLKVLALTRILCPNINIPATTALATINPEKGRSHALQRGANVVMPNLTPHKYRTLYQIYPGKAGLHETAEFSREEIERQIISLGRTIGRGAGTSSHFKQHCH
ncbi:MAG: [FeFe] hydrogenase H-cluster radical SAM maturase HydE [Holophagaceae bacterium]|nr:[FeFe] hydrogenase H-cluster radical SAM maturase HydE [Holophagaceae bacterium]